MTKDTNFLQETLTKLKTEKDPIFKEALKKAILKTIQEAKEKRVLIESAVSLTDEEKISLQKTLKQIIKKDLDINFEVNEKILGGLKIKMDDWNFDSSLKTQLDKMSYYFK